MGLINRYLLRAHIGPFILGASTVVFLFLFQFVLKHLGKFLGKGIDPSLILWLIANVAPAFIMFGVPMGVLFATIFAFGSMSANYEIIIIKSGGSSLLRMMRPFILIGMILSLFMFWFNDVVLPESNHEQKVLLNDITRKKPTFGLDKGQFSTAIEQFTVLARNIDSISGEMYGVTIYDNSKPRRRNIVNADTGTIKFNENTATMVMDMKSGEIVQLLDQNLRGVKKIEFDRYTLQMRDAGFKLERSDDQSRSQREMNIATMNAEVEKSRELRKISERRSDAAIEKHLKYITCEAFPEKINTIYAGNLATRTVSAGNPSVINRATDPESGALIAAENRLAILKSVLYSDYQMIKHQILEEKSLKVEIHKKYALPFACLVFVFVGCPLGVRTRGGNFGVSALISLGFYILYWACLIGGEKLADRGLLSPFLAMWMGNIIVGVLGIFLTLKVNNENLNFGRSLKKLFAKK